MTICTKSVSQNCLGQYRAGEWLCLCLFSIFQITLGIRGATGKAQYRAQKEKNNPIKILDLSLLGADLILGSKQICSGAFPLLPQYIKVCIYYLWIASSGGFCIFCRLLEMKDHLGSPSRCHPGLIVKPSWRWSLIIEISHDCEESSCWGLRSECSSLSPTSRKFVSNFIT